MLKIRPPASLWAAKNEAAAIAVGLLQRHRFCCAFHDSSFPTAWLAPGYPALVAVLFELFGVRTSASALVLVSINVFLSSLTAVAIYKLGKACFGSSIGLFASWTWAISPLAVIMPLLLWDSCLSALLLPGIFLLILQLQNTDRTRAWAGAGAAVGLSALVNPALLIPLPFVIARVVWMCKPRQNKILRDFSVFLALFFAAVAPWTVRNTLVFGQLIPMRSNFWAEFSFGNLGFDTHPVGPSTEYQREGEIAFISAQRHRSLGYLGQRTGEFAKNTLERMGQFWIVPDGLLIYSAALSMLAWTGLALALLRHESAAFPFLGVMLLYPALYYVTYVFSRYRHPIEPFMHVLAVYAICRILRVRSIAG